MAVPHRPQVDELVDRVIRADDPSAATDLGDLVRGDHFILERVRSVLLARMLSRSLTGVEVRRTAEVLADVESIRRERLQRRIERHRTWFSGLQGMYARLVGASRAERPVAVTAQICESLGFAKSMYSSVGEAAWNPATIAIQHDLQGFDELRRAVGTSAIHTGAAPREDEIIRRRPRGLVVSFADSRRNTYRPLIDLSRPRGYVVMPVVAAGQVRSIIHADRDEVDIADSDLMAVEAVARICSAVEERDLLRDRIRSQSRHLRDDLSALGEALAEVERSAVTLADVTGAPAAEASRLALLSEREREVVELACQGRTNAEVAQRLVISDETVKSHLRRSYRKLGVGARAEAAAMLRAASSTQPAPRAS